MTSPSVSSSKDKMKQHLDGGLTDRQKAKRPKVLEADGKDKEAIHAPVTDYYAPPWHKKTNVSQRSTELSFSGLANKHCHNQSWFDRIWRRINCRGNACGVRRKSVLCMNHSTISRFIKMATTKGQTRWPCRAWQDAIDSGISLLPTVFEVEIATSGQQQMPEFFDSKLPFNNDVLNQILVSWSFLRRYPVIAFKISFYIQHFDMLDVMQRFLVERGLLGNPLACIHCSKT